MQSASGDAFVAQEMPRCKHEMVETVEIKFCGCLRDGCLDSCCAAITGLEDLLTSAWYFTVSGRPPPTVHGSDPCMCPAQLNCQTHYLHLT
jgi:hypothetical protein